MVSLSYIWLVSLGHDRLFAAALSGQGRLGAHAVSPNATHKGGLLEYHVHNVWVRPVFLFGTTVSASQLTGIPLSFLHHRAIWKSRPQTWPCAPCTPINDLSSLRGRLLREAGGRVLIGLEVRPSVVVSSTCRFETLLTLDLI